MSMKTPEPPSDTAPLAKWIEYGKRMRNVADGLLAERIDRIKKMHGVAANRGYCSEFDEIMEELGLPERPAGGSEFCCSECASDAFEASLIRHGAGIDPMTLFTNPL